MEGGAYSGWYKSTTATIFNAYSRVLTPHARLTPPNKYGSEKFILSTAGFAMLATMELVELVTELFPVLKGRIDIEYSLQALTLVQPTSTTPCNSPSYHCAVGATFVSFLVSSPRKLQGHWLGWRPERRRRCVASNVYKARTMTKNHTTCYPTPIDNFICIMVNALLAIVSTSIPLQHRNTFCILAENRERVEYVEFIRGVRTKELPGISACYPFNPSFA
ncbi:hypothetical protein M0802_010501 [Mischocyttarus mexicanus]|nr:hypothetical protein M0802_010501 [Mischocyttarus mexicanus]